MTIKRRKEREKERARGADILLQECSADTFI